MSSALVPCIRPVRPFGLLRPALDYGNQAAKAHALLRCRRQRLVVVSVRRQKKIPEPTPWDQLELNDEYYASIGKTKEEADEEPKFFRPDEIGESAPAAERAGGGKGGEGGGGMAAGPPEGSPSSCTVS